MILLITEDDCLADTLAEKFLNWGMRLARRRGIDEGRSLFSSSKVAMVLLDVRRGGKETVERLIKLNSIAKIPPVVLLNKSDNIQVSMAGMRAGAADELTEPFCTETIKHKVIELGHGAVRTKKKRGLFAAFSAAMAAAAMAQGGEFDAAIEIYNDLDKHDKP